MWILFISGLAISVFVGAFIDVSHVPWRYVEASSILFGSLAIVSAISDMRAHVSENKLVWLRSRAINSMEILRHVAAGSLGIIDQRLTASKDVSGCYGSARTWFSSVCDQISIDAQVNVAPLRGRIPVFPEVIKEREVYIMKNELDVLIDRYDEAAERCVYEEKKTKTTFSDEVMTQCMPAIITVAASLALFKALYQP